jgi:phosphoadenosine phosphosulfate reductase
VIDEMKRLGLAEDVMAIGDAGTEGDIGRGTGMILHMQDGFSPCIQGYTIEGAFNRSLDIDRVANVLAIIGAVELNDKEGWCLLDGMRIFKEGVLIAKGSSPEDVREKVEKVRKAVVKAMECVGCGVCVARCDQGALSLQKDRIRVATSKCKHCGSCIEPCPAISFGDSAFEF